MLQDAVGKPSGRSAHVDARAPLQRDPPMLECVFQLEPAAADVAQVIAQQAQHGSLVDWGPRLLHALFGDQHAPSQDERLRALARGRQPPLHQRLVQPYLHPPLRE